MSNTSMALPAPVEGRLSAPLQAMLRQALEFSVQLVRPRGANESLSDLSPSQLKDLGLDPEHIRARQRPLHLEAMV